MNDNVTPVADGGKTPITLDPSKIPQELKGCAQWVLHRDKVPYQSDGSKASVTNPNTFSTFPNAFEALQGGGFDGLGFVFTKEDPYCGIDLDGCRDPVSGEIAPWAQDIIDDVDSYSEVSLSGRGIHIIARASLPEARKVDGIEIYSSRRCFVMTGQHLEGTPPTVEDRDDVVNELRSELTAQQGGFGAKTAIVDPSTIDWDADPESIKPWVEEKVASDPQFRRTWEQNRPDLHDQSMSAYDLALAAQAVWNHGCADPTRLYLLIRLHREEHGNPKQKKKATRRDYICRTIGMALASLDEEGNEVKSDTRVPIKVEAGEMPSITRQAAAALGSATRTSPFKGIYRHGNRLVLVARRTDRSELAQEDVK